MVKKAQRAARQAKRAKLAPATVPNWLTEEFWQDFIHRVLAEAANEKRAKQ